MLIHFLLVKYKKGERGMGGAKGPLGVLKNVVDKY
jgi:hypothetical protein